MRRLGHIALLCLVLVSILHGCGSYQPIVAAPLTIYDVLVRPQAAGGVKVLWSTTDPASSRIDYGPAPSSTQTFYQYGQNGIGLDGDGHIQSEKRTNDTTQGPIVNSVLDLNLVTQHSLMATEATTTTTTYFAITSVNRDGQTATATVTLPRPNPIIRGFP